MIVSETRQKQARTCCPSSPTGRPSWNRTCCEVTPRPISCRPEKRPASQAAVQVTTSILLVWFLLLAGWALPSSQILADDQPNSKLKLFDFEEIQMGVDFRIRLYGPDSMVANKAAKAAFARIEQLNAALSDYDEASEVRRLCDLSTGKPTKVSRDLFVVLEAAQQLSVATDGAFDVTVGPLTKLWRRARRQKELPDPKLLAEAREAVGFRFVILNREAQTVTLTKPNVRIDLGGIAKGYAVDEALKVLADHGINRAMVDGSGDMAIGDPPPDRDAWTIEVAALDQSDTLSAATLKLKNCGVATSGDAFQHIEIAGRKYSHIVDPKTGLGLSESSSVTIIAPTGLTADSLASAVSVLGPKAGIEFIDRHQQYPDCEALVLTAADPKTGSSTSPRFESKSFRDFVQKK